MNFIIKDRGMGKTTDLILTSQVTNFRILTLNEMQARLVKELAKHLNYSIPEPMSYSRYRNEHICDKGLLLDEVNFMLDPILEQYFHCPVYAGTMSI